jgi:hypothetical protein
MNLFEGDDDGQRHHKPRHGGDPDRKR